MNWKMDAAGRIYKPHRVHESLHLGRDYADAAYVNALEVKVAWLAEELDTAKAEREHERALKIEAQDEAHRLGAGPSA